MADVARPIGSSTGRRSGSSRMSSSKSVAMTPPKSPGAHRVPSATLMKQTEVPPSPEKWKTHHEQAMFKQISFHRLERKDSKLHAKQQAVHLARKIPMELLAKDWLNDNQMTLDTRAYLVDQVLPTLILGVEKLLIEADKRELTDKQLSDPNFNPINFLAQYLMRNNPRYSNLLETSPYVRTLREIGEQLKQQIFQLEDNKLARIKNDAKKKREEREKAVEVRKLEKTRRISALQAQYLEWASNIEEPSTIRMELSLVQSALKSFSDMVEYLPDELKSSARYTEPIGETDETGRTLSQRDFVEMITSLVEDFSSALFDQFLSHMSRCAAAYKNEIQRDQRKATLTNLFVVCDHTGVGILDRHRILSLFESFYDQQPDEVRKQMKLRNPRKWPVVEVDEADSESEDEEEFNTEAPTIEITDQTSSAITTESTLSTDTTLTKTAMIEAEEARVKSATEKHESEAPEKTEPPTDSQTDLAQAVGAEDTEALQSISEDKTFADEMPVDTEKKADEPEKTVDEKEKAAPAEPVAAPADPVTAPADPVAAPADPVAAPAEPVAAPSAPEAAPADTGAVTAEPAETSDKTEEATAQLTEPSEAPPSDPAAEAAAEPPAGEEKEPSLEREATDMTISLSKEKSTLEKKPPTRGGAFSVSFAEGTNLLQRERTTLETRGTGSQSQMSAFDENTLNMSQFIQLTETFIGNQPALEIFQSLCRYMRDGYIETEEEKMARLMRAHKEAQMIKHRARLNGLFEKWDNEGSGYLDIEEIDTIVHKYKDGLEKQAINRGKFKLLTQMKQESGAADSRLTKREFNQLMHLIVEEIGGDNTFDFFIDFVESCVEFPEFHANVPCHKKRTYAEKIRGEARKKWLNQITLSAETSAASLETVYRSVFQALYRDAETHGNGKIISANITMLEQTPRNVSNRGEKCLRYVATTTDDVSILLNQILYKDMKGISFAAIETGKPLHVPRVTTHGNIQFWNPEQDESDRDGSFVVIPLKDHKKRVFGTIGVDTLRDPHSKSIFITHEIQFYQGVGNAFNVAFHYVDTKRKTLRITESAISWICRRSFNVHEINVYLVEADGKNQDYVLRRMMVCVGDKAEVKSFDTPSRLERKDNLFRDYLFKCVDNSETVTADAYGQRHFAFPLRGADGRAVLVIDISTGENKQIPRHERREMVRMLKLVQRAQKEITAEQEEGQKNLVLNAEKENEDTRVEIMFDRLMLTDLRKHVAKLDAKALAELKHYKEPPAVIKKIVQGTVSLFYPDVNLDDWGICKSHIDTELSKKIAEFDPTQEGSENIPVDELEKSLKEIPHGAISKHGSQPAESLYNWLYVCLSLIQHCKRMRLSEGQQGSRKMLPTGMTPDAMYDDDE